MNQIPQKIRQIKQDLDVNRLAKKGADYLESITPIDKGNARRNTYATGPNIIADYEYAGRLDDNHSKQTKGKGLIDPTLNFLTEIVTKLG
jgi:hypothetical protein